MIFSQLSNIQQRLIISCFSVFFVLLAIYFSYNPGFSPIFALLTAGLISAALWEYYSIAKTKGFQPLIKIGILGTLFYVFACYLRFQVPDAKFLPEIILGLTLIAAFLYYFIKGHDPFVNLAITAFGMLYITIPLSYMLNVNYFISEPFVADGRFCLLYLLLVTKMTDTAAFFVGREVGRRKLSPYISPKKTWEGALGGLCGALATGIVLYGISHLFFTTVPFNLSFFQTLWLSTLISVTAQFGDLAESLLKRDVGIKDSSYIPGLGGVLDIFDSLVFTSPLMYFFLENAA